MKKKWILLAIMAIVTGFSSCSSSSSFETDVKKMAMYQCEMRQLMTKDDEKSQKKLAELQKDAEDYADKMRVKYKDKEDDKEFEARGDKIMEEEMAKCK